MASWNSRSVSPASRTKACRCFTSSESNSRVRAFGVRCISCSTAAVTSSCDSMIIDFLRGGGKSTSASVPSAVAAAAAATTVATAVAAAGGGLEAATERAFGGAQLGRGHASRDRRALRRAHTLLLLYGRRALDRRRETPPGGLSRRCAARRLTHRLRDGGRALDDRHALRLGYPVIGRHLHCCRTNEATG